MNVGRHESGAFFAAQGPPPRHDRSAPPPGPSHKPRRRPGSKDQLSEVPDVPPANENPALSFFPVPSCRLVPWVGRFAKQRGRGCRVNGLCRKRFHSNRAFLLLIPSGPFPQVVKLVRSCAVVSFDDLRL